MIAANLAPVLRGEVLEGVRLEIRQGFFGAHPCITAYIAVVDCERSPAKRVFLGSLGLPLARDRADALEHFRSLCIDVLTRWIASLWEVSPADVSTVDVLEVLHGS